MNYIKPLVAILGLAAAVRLARGKLNVRRLLVRSGYDLFPNPGGRRWMLHIMYAPIAFQATRAALELGVFDLLKEQPGLTAEQVTEALGLEHANAIRLLLRACVATRALEKRGERYSLGFKIDVDILRDHINQAHVLMYRQLFYMKEAVEQEKPVGLYKVYGCDNEQDFYAAKRNIPELHEAWNPHMTRYAHDNRRKLLKKFDYGAYKHVIDVGCNDAELMVQVVQQNPGIRATVIDLPDSPGLKNSRANIEKHGLQDRIEAIGLDAFESPLPGGADLVQFMHFVNMFAPERNKGLLKRAYDALVPGGTLMIVGPVVDETEDGFFLDEPVLYSMVFLVCRTGEGEIYPSSMIADWFKETGFVDVKTQRIGMLERIITGRKP